MSISKILKEARPAFSPPVDKKWVRQDGNPSGLTQSLLQYLLDIGMDNLRKRILIIEDDEEMRSLLKDFFEEDGFEIDSVSNGSEAFRRVATEPFDLIITDIRMPGLTGLDILPGVKKLQPKAHVIVITAFGSEEVRRKVFERGASAYLEKPVFFNKLRTLVHEMVF